MIRNWICLGVAIGLIGCGDGNSSKPLPKTVPVSGVVTLDGKPLASAAVVFIPRGATKGIECFGATGEKGDYKMKQLRGEDGAPPGDYAVIVNRYVKKDGTPIVLGSTDLPANVGAVESLPPQYSSPTATKLTAVVPASGGVINFDLKSK